MNAFKFIWLVAKPFKKFLLIPLIVLTYLAIDTSLRPYVVKLLINSAVSKHFDIMGFYALIFCIMQFLIPISWRIYDACHLTYDPKMRAYIAKTLFSYVAKHSYSFFQNTFAGSMANKIDRAVSSVPMIIDVLTCSIYYNIITVSIACVVMSFVNIWFGVAIFIWSAVIITTALSIINKYRYLNNIVAEKSSRFMGFVVDCMSNILNIKLFASFKKEDKNLDIYQKEFVDASKRRSWFLFKFYTMLGFTFALYQTACISLLIYLMKHNQVTAGDFAMIFAINSSLVISLWEMSDKLKVLSENFGALEESVKTIYTNYEVDDSELASDIEITHPSIKFQDVQFYYNKNKKLFKNLNIEIKAGEKVGLVGHSGSGKSTFISLILRLFDVKNGAIKIGGHDVKEFKQDSLRSQISMIPQDPTLFHRSVLENISYGKEDASYEDVVEAAKKAYADEFINAIPESYEAKVGERGIKLSGGQRQRIAIARAILKNSKILILDEATSQLDSITEKEIQKAMRHLMHEKTTIIIAHRLSTLLEMDRILVFNNGDIIASGSHEELIATSSVYKKMWDSQVNGFINTKDVL